MIDRSTRLCISLSARPGNFGTRFHNHLYGELGLNYVYKAFATKDLPGVTGHITIDAQRNASKSAVILTVKDGRFVYVETVAP